MKSILILFCILVLLAGFFATFWYVQNSKIKSEVETKPIEIGTEVKTPEIPLDIANHIKEKNDKIVLESPLPLSKITSPVTIKGKARGFWFFEASFPIYIVNWDGLIIGEGIATADGEWMTTDFVPFTASINFNLDKNTYSNKGALILKKDNPSGLPENDDALEIPVVLEVN